MFSFPIKQVPEVLTRFFGGFRECFTPGTQEMMQEYFVSLFLPHKRFSIQAVASSKEPDAQYQRLQYAFSDTDWNPAQLDDMRLQYIMRSPATVRPAGPPPITATFLPVGARISGISSLACSASQSARKRSRRPIAICPPFFTRTHVSSHCSS